MSMRLDKINRQLTKETSLIIQRDLADTAFQFVTITHVEVSRDLRHARVYFSLLGDEAHLTIVQGRLNRASGLIRRSLGRQIKMRFTPELIFVYDDSIVKGARIEETLQEIKNESEQNSADD